MSRVGKVPIQIPAGVKFTMQDRLVHVVGPKGQLEHSVPEGVIVSVQDSVITVARDEMRPDLQGAALHGLTRTILANLVHGVSTGFTRELDIVGVGYRASVSGRILNLMVGYSHPIEYQLPAGIGAKVDNNTHITLTGSDKVLLGMVASQVRAFRSPEPYKGKGIKYSNEVIIRKLGKAAGAK